MTDQPNVTVWETTARIIDPEVCVTFLPFVDAEGGRFEVWSGCLCVGQGDTEQEAWKQAFSTLDRRVPPQPQVARVWLGGERRKVTFTDDQPCSNCGQPAMCDC